MLGGHLGEETNSKEAAGCRDLGATQDIHNQVLCRPQVQLAPFPQKVQLSTRGKKRLSKVPCPDRYRLCPAVPLVVGVGSCLCWIIFPLQGGPLGPFLAGDTKLQAPSPLPTLAGDTGDPLLQVLQQSFLGDNLLEDTWPVDPAPLESPGEGQQGRY